MTAFLHQILLAPGILVRFRVASWLPCRWMLGNTWQESQAGAGFYCILTFSFRQFLVSDFVINMMMFFWFV